MTSNAPVSVLLKEVEERLAAVAERPFGDLTDGEVLEVAVAAQRLSSMVDGLCARSAAAVDASRAWVPDGAASASAWLAWRCKVAKARTSSHLKLGRHLRTMPATQAALAAGEISLDHARLLASAQAAAPEVFADGGEDELLDAARGLAFSQFQKVIRYWRYRACGDDEERRARQRWLDRSAHCSTTLEGKVAVRADLDPVGGATFARELARLEHQLYDEDVAEARHRLGVRDVPYAELVRTAAQRRADALVLMATRSAAKPPGAVEGVILLHALVGAETLERLCELTDGQVLTPGELLPHLTRAHLQRAVFDPTGTKVLDLGPRRRLFTGATRLAVELRDRGCTHPTCDVPLERCEVDHVQPYAADGPTIQGNGRCRCPYHHRRAP
jgi:hypothetical protein